MSCSRNRGKLREHRYLIFSARQVVGGDSGLAGIGNDFQINLRGDNIILTGEINLFPAATRSLMALAMAEVRTKS